MYLSESFIRFCAEILLVRLGFGILEIVFLALWKKDSLPCFQGQGMALSSSLKNDGKNK